MSRVSNRPRAGSARVEFVALNILHTGALIQPACTQIAFHHLKIDMPFTAVTVGGEYPVQQRQTQTATVRAGVNHQIADKRAGPAVRHRDHALCIFKDQAQAPVRFGISVESIPPYGEVRDAAAAVLAPRYQQLVHSSGILWGEWHLTHVGGPDHIGRGSAEVPTHQPVMPG